MDKVNVILKSTWTKAFLINAVIFIVIIITTDFMYETNDDHSVALRLADGYPYIGFINYYLCKILVLLQNWLDMINVFVWFQIIMSFIAFTVLIKLILDRNATVLIKLLAIAAVSVYCIDHYYCIQFTKTSALLLIAGTAVLVDNIVDLKPLGNFAIAGILIIMGTWLRDYNQLVAVGYMCVFLFFWLIFNYRGISKDDYINKKRIILYVLTVVLLAGTYYSSELSVQKNSSTEELAEYYSYTGYRADILDYPLDESKMEQYGQLGLSENDVRLIREWFLDYNGAASPEKLEEMSRINSEGKDLSSRLTSSVQAFVDNTISNVRNLTPTGIHIILLLLMSLIAFMHIKPKYYVYIIALGCCAVCLYVYLYFIGRTVYRASYVIDIATTVWIIYFLDSKYFRSGRVQLFNGIKKAVLIMSTILIVGLQFSFYSDYNEDYVRRNEAKTPDILTAYLQENIDKGFVFATKLKGNSEEYLNPLRYPLGDYKNNTTNFGNWGTYSPYQLNQFKSFGITNAFEDLIDNDNVYAVIDKNRAEMFEEYLNKWYGSDKKMISCKLYDTVEEFYIWKIESN